MRVNKDRIELWAQALESGKHEQCTDRLRHFEPLQDGSKIQMNCVLGVGILVAVENGCNLSPSFQWEAATQLPREVGDWYGLEERNPKLDLTEEDLQFSPDHSSWNLYFKDRRDLIPNHRNINTMMTVNDTMLLPFKIIAELLRRTYVDEK